ncbi:hypothetical protein COLO4_04903 [Corchorus olitorius]|uniref:Uncharacterized protein n=1 Tax=Corchorus olitorius TaxID=93759 RepID=A0A1R3KSK9_9ROSI|nr:hypothetical protein COLO4_04903 [Corchorus olitorius]
MERRDTLLLDSSCSDFEFNISLEQQSCSADELFANGMLLPVRLQRNQRQVQKSEAPAPAPGVVSQLPPRPNFSTVEDSKKESKTQTQTQIKALHLHSELEDQIQKPQSKSFWGFKRSSSLNCDKKKSLICSLPLLSRSNSTSSVPNSKRSSSIKDSNKQKNPSISISSCNAYQFPQKPPVKRNHGNSYGNGVRISPVLNVPPPYISKGTANLFGLGSFLRNGKDMKISRK